MRTFLHCEREGCELRVAIHRVRCAAATFVAVSIALGLTGCSQSSEPTQTPAVDVSAELDRSTGAVVLPEDRYRLVEFEWYKLDDAKSALVAECTTAQGVPYPVSHSASLEYLYSTLFGVWTKSVAEKFAFVPPSPEADMAANGVLIDGEPVEYASDGPSKVEIRESWSDADREIVEACQQSSEVESLDAAQFFETGPWSRELGDTSAGFMRTPEAQEIADEYEACLRESGLEPASGSEGSVEGADFATIDPEQIALALQVVECKDQVDYVQGLADVLAAQQAPIVEKYAAEMIAHRQKIDAKLAEADQILADYQAQ